MIAYYSDLPTIDMLGLADPWVAQHGFEIPSASPLAYYPGHVKMAPISYLERRKVNLLIGLPDPGDQALLQTMQRTGMDKIVAAHPKGLDRAIMEGGKGLSGGQVVIVSPSRRDCFCSNSNIVSSSARARTASAWARSRSDTCATILLPP